MLIKNKFQIKPSVKNAVVLLSGGLRTVYGMADVISNSIADGVGLGKPSMAEPGNMCNILAKTKDQNRNGFIIQYMKQTALFKMDSSG